MNVEITVKNDRPVLSREEIEANVTFEGSTPSRIDLAKELAKVTKAKPELVVVRKIDTSFGETTAKVSAFVYKDEKVMKEIEGKYMINRHAEKAKEEAAPAAAPAPEGDAPAEEAKEEAAEEKPTEEAPAEEAPAEKPAEEPAEEAAPEEAEKSK